MREMAGCGDGVARWVGRVAGGVVARLEGLRRGIGPGTPLGDPGDLELLCGKRPGKWAAPLCSGLPLTDGSENRAANPFDPRKSYRTRLAPFCSCYRAPDCGRHSMWPLWTGRFARAWRGVRAAPSTNAPT